MTKEDYIKLLNSGMFWEIYPELSGNWDKDSLILNKPLINNKMTEIEEILNAYGEDSTYIYEPDKYGTQVALLHVTPFWICGMSARLSHKSWNKQSHDSDLALLKKLEKAGDDHAKAVVKGLQFYVLLTATRYIWAEMDTYTIGRTPLGSTSTMHTEAKGLTGEELVKVKDNLKESTLQTRCFCVSYRTLTRIVGRRKHHRLPHWQYICNCFQDIINGSGMGDEI